MTIPTTCIFCNKMSPYPNIIAEVMLEEKIYAYKLKCVDCGEEYWTIWNMNLNKMPPIYIDYERVKKEHEDSVKHLEELNTKAEAEVNKLKPKIIELRKNYKRLIKMRRNLTEILDKLMEEH